MIPRSSRPGQKMSPQGASDGSPRGRARRIALPLAGLLALVYAAVVAYAATHQARYFFDPSDTPSAPIPTRAPGFSQVQLVTRDGERLIGWWIPPAPGSGVVLYLHGNSGNVGDRARRLGDTAAHGYGVLAIDYRGYAGSTGTPSERGLYADGDAAWAFARQAAPGRPVVIWGESIGTAVASELAGRVDEAGVILDSPFTSMVDLVRLRARWFPYPLVTQRFDNRSRIAAIGSPLLIAHCRPDGTVPFAMGEALYAAASPPKQFVPLDGCAHIKIWREPAKTQILEFLAARLRPPPPDRPPG